MVRTSTGAVPSCICNFYQSVQVECGLVYVPSFRTPSRLTSMMKQLMERQKRTKITIIFPHELKKKDVGTLNICPWWSNCATILFVKKNVRVCVFLLLVCHIMAVWIGEAVCCVRSGFILSKFVPVTLWVLRLHRWFFRKWALLFDPESCRSVTSRDVLRKHYVIKSVMLAF